MASLATQFASDWEDGAVFHKQSFVDHAGQSAVRIRYDEPEALIPQKLAQTPVFAFQIYTTFPIDAEEEDEAPAPKRAKGAHSTDGSMSSNLRSMITYLGRGLNDSQRPAPVYEIYSPQTDAFACVEHQRREIAYRKAHRDEESTILIPKVSKGTDSDLRRTGFLIVFTSDCYKVDLANTSLQYDPNGPLWV
jgi:hypothetical protein